MNLSGTLSDWSVSDLLNVMKVTAKTASLTIRADVSGTVDFVEGRVADARIAGEPSADFGPGTRESVADALFILSAATQGAFEVVRLEAAATETWEVEELLADMGELGKLQKDLAEAGLDAASLTLRDEIDAPLTIPAGDWWAMASLVSVLSFRELEDVFGRARATRLLHTLWRLGVIEVLEDPALSAGQPTEDTVVEIDTEMLEERAPTEVEIESEPERVADRGDESWLDEIAEAAAGSDAEWEASPVGGEETTGARRPVMGVAAPPSTVLTGSVLDEMRRLRGRSGT